MSELKIKRLLDNQEQSAVSRAMYNTQRCGSSPPAPVRRVLGWPPIGKATCGWDLNLCALSALSCAVMTASHLSGRLIHSLADTVGPAVTRRKARRRPPTFAADRQALF